MNNEELERLKNLPKKKKKVSAKRKLEKAFVNALLDDFQENGKKAVEVVRAIDPGAYLRVIAGVIPKDVTANVKTDSTVTVHHRGLSRATELLENFAAGRPAIHGEVVVQDGSLLPSKVSTGEE